MREIETQLSDSRVSNNSVVDHCVHGRQHASCRAMSAVGQRPVESSRQWSSHLFNGRPSARWMTPRMVRKSTKLYHRLAESTVEHFVVIHLLRCWYPQLIELWLLMFQWWMHHTWVRTVQWRSCLKSSRCVNVNIWFCSNILWTLLDTSSSPVSASESLLVSVSRRLTDLYQDQSVNW